MVTVHPQCLHMPRQ